jgi:3-methyladenine DNA glycosylase AlkD
MRTPNQQTTGKLGVSGAEALARTVGHDLRRQANPARAQGVQQYFKHSVVSLGIDSPTLREFAKVQVKELKGRWDLADAVELCDRLLQEHELEIRGAGLLMLSAFQKNFTPSLLGTAERWLQTRLDNWALVDSFCALVLSPLLLKHEAALKTLRQWSRAKSLWVRRASVVTLVPFARRGRLLDTVYQFAQRQFAAPEDLMHKATGWLLREAGKTDMPGLRAFLLQHGPSIPRTTLRYAIERFAPLERKKLLEATRSATR